MNLPEIKHYSAKVEIQSNDLFALSKGLNVGKPLEEPCPNCFVIRCTNWKQKETYKAILYAAWKTNAFDNYLYGSVIPFIRIQDFKNVVTEKAKKAFNNYRRFETDFKRYLELEKYEASIAKQLQLIRELKHVYIMRHIK
ncbi:DUF6943 family protein [Faecalibacter bovis]|uniref:Uncharacterized protein n=1 Tax=Faecalibacter bovis TaxID=2898187 RepID=A0ABX7XA65_9FLAO|nr:hypothetical protein [Faecalibacter bovis]QTV04780.1 hypothetical protein J9309_08160 [Faecalibacter bovis]